MARRKYALAHIAMWFLLPPEVCDAATNLIMWADTHFYHFLKGN
jgi:hypothetical protein